MYWLRFIGGILLLAMISAWLLFSSPGQVTAENVTVSGTVNQVSTLKLSTTAVNLPAGNPTETKSLEPALTVTIVRNSAWQLHTQALASSLTDPSNPSSTIPLEKLQWKGGEATDYTSFATTLSRVAGGTGPTSGSGEMIDLSFKLSYPWNATPGAYTIQIALLLS